MTEQQYMEHQARVRKVAACEPNAHPHDGTAATPGMSSLEAPETAQGPVSAQQLALHATPDRAALSPIQRMYAKGRLKRGELNGTEQAYQDYLQAELNAGRIRWFRFEAIKLRLANNTFYTADFAVMTKDCAIELHEVKGHWLDDARAKIKISAEQYPLFRFIAVQKRANKHGGGWTVEEF